MAEPSVEGSSKPANQPTNPSAVMNGEDEIPSNPQDDWLVIPHKFKKKSREEDKKRKGKMIEKEINAGISGNRFDGLLEEDFSDENQGCDHAEIHVDNSLYGKVNNSHDQPMEKRRPIYVKKKFASLIQSLLGKKKKREGIRIGLFRR